MKICPVVAEFYHKDGQMYMTKLVAAFRNFTNAPTILTLFQTGLIKERTVDNIVKIQTWVDKYLTPKRSGLHCDL